MMLQVVLCCAVCCNAPNECMYSCFMHRYVADGTSEKAPACNKALNDVKALCPGVFVMHCLKCSECIGFHMMPSSESPRTLFEVLFTRWPVAPSVVVYDNGCNAHTYVLNREPDWCKDTLYVVDKLHYKGHVACSIGYNIAEYEDLAKLNSSMAEQKVGCLQCGC